MATRKGSTTTTTDGVLDAVLASNTPAQAARALSMEGKSFRSNVLRAQFGLYVSRGGTFDERAKRYAHAYVTRTSDRPAIKAAWQNGDDAPPVGE